MPSSSLEVRPLTGGCGAEILNVDLGRSVDDAALKTIETAFHDHGVIFFRDQMLSSEQHRTFARRWGDIVVNRFFEPVEGYPDIAVVGKTEAEIANIGGDWHADHSYDALPPMGSILVARELPPSGGDTIFANMYKTYENLSSGLKRSLEGLRAVHSAEQVFGPNGLAAQQRGGKISHLNSDLAGGEVVHPVVIEHPASRRPALYVNPNFTLRFEGWTAAESRPLLEYLYHQAVQPEVTCRFHWTPGSVAFWDNRSTWHYAVNDYQGQRRLMHRITVAGGKLSAFHIPAEAEAA